MKKEPLHRGEEDSKGDERLVPSNQSYAGAVGQDQHDIVRRLENALREAMIREEAGYFAAAFPQRGAPNASVLPLNPVSTILFSSAAVIIGLTGARALPGRLGEARAMVAKLAEFANVAALTEIVKAVAQRARRFLAPTSDGAAAFGEPYDPRCSIRRLNVAGFSVMAVLVGGIGAWSATAQLAGAVIAPGSLVVETNVKKVQHPTGGVVGTIYVQEGTSVEEGQVLMRLDETVSRSTLGVVRSQLDELTARECRLIAERDGAEGIVFPQDLVDRSAERSVATAISGEEKLFASRQGGRKGQRSQLAERIAQTREEIAGLTAQQEAKERETKLIGEELVGVTTLYKQNLVTIQRLNALQRDQARLEGERGQLIAEIARARAKIGELQLQLLQLEQDFRTEVLKELREVQGKIAELAERKAAAEDQLKRIEIRAPQSGVVHQLSVHTVGGVIASGETIMQIVPSSDKLLVEAKVAPQEIDQVTVGANASVRIMAGNQRTTPELDSEVVLIGADLVKEQPNQVYYLVRASVKTDQLQKLDDTKLVPGMPVELFIQTRERTALQYLIKPLQEQIARTFRER